MPIKIPKSSGLLLFFILNLKKQGSDTFGRIIMARSEDIDQEVGYFRGVNFNKVFYGYAANTSHPAIMVIIPTYYFILLIKFLKYSAL